MAIIVTSAIGTSPAFPITAEELALDYFTTVTAVDIDGVQPPTLGAQGGASVAFDFINLWFPWIDDKLVEAKWDGVAQFLGMPSNRPSFIRDFHMITLFRAADYIARPAYVAYIQALVNTPTPIAPPPEGA